MQSQNLWSHVAGRAIIAATLCLTLSCASEEVTAPLPDDDVPIGDELSREDVVNALSEIRDFRRSLASDDRLAYSASLVAHLLQRSDVRGAGISWDQSVWAEFSNGLSVAFVNNRRPDDSQPSAAAAVQARSEPRANRSISQEGIPEGDNAHVISLGEPSRAFLVIAEYLASSGYRLHGGGIKRGSVEDFRSVRDADLVMINSHGAVVGGGRYVVGTNDHISEAEARAGNAGADRNWNEAEAGLLALVQFDDDSVNHIVHWAITAKFVKQYWQLNARSLVFVDGCTSFGDGTESTDFRNEVIQSGASSYLGWMGVTGILFADEVGTTFFDRVLGMNDFDPEKPPQRPFNYRQVLIWMGEQGRDFWSYTDRRGTFISWLRLEETGQESGILVPTIKRLRVDELNEQLTIEGQFGSEPTGGQVTVGDVRAFVDSWNKNEIVVRLPANSSELPFAGSVQVKVREHESNEVPLTGWQGPFTYSADLSQVWAPGLKQTVTCDLHFRGDVHPYREKPGADPTSPAFRLVAAKSSRCSFKMSGTGQRANGDTYSLAGEDSMKWFSDSPNTFSFNLRADALDQVLDSAYLSLSAWGDLTITSGGSVISDSIVLTVDQEPLLGVTQCPPPIPPPGFAFPMAPGVSEGWGIKKDSRTGDGPCGVTNTPTELNWEAIQAQSAPTDSTAS